MQENIFAQDSDVAHGIPHILGLEMVWTIVQPIGTDYFPQVPTSVDLCPLLKLSSRWTFEVMHADGHYHME